MLLAHLTDSHLLELGRGPSIKDRLVSPGRPLDARGRYDRLLGALKAAKSGGAGHFVLTGDLAETGSVGQYEALALAFEEARIEPSRVTLLPGNHDRYDRDDAWERALSGPLAAFAPTSAVGERLAVVELGHARLVAVDATRPQNLVRSQGLLRASQLARVGQEVEAAAASGAHLVLALHHGPTPLTPHPWHLWNGLDGAHRLLRAAHNWPSASFLHGHSHAERSRAVGEHVAHCGHAVVARGARAVALYRASRDGAELRLVREPSAGVDAQTLALAT